jgi:hypothetical protein
MRTVLVVLLLLLASLRTADACDCAIGATDETLLDKSAAIFVGRVVSKPLQASPTDAWLTMRVEVLATWRGVDAGTIVTVRTEASDCGYSASQGSTMLFFTNAKSETRQCTTDQDVRFATAKSLAFLGPPKAEVSDQVLAKCSCNATPVTAKGKPDFEYRAGTPLADGRYAISIPLKTTRRPSDRFKDAPLPSSISSPSGGCALRAPASGFSFVAPTFGETAHVNRCIADQLRVPKK